MKNDYSVASSTELFQEVFERVLSRSFVLPMDTARLTLPHKTNQVKVQTFNTYQNPEVLFKFVSLRF